SQIILMKKIRVAINGFGRIGRITSRNIMKQDNVELVAINDLADAATLAHLFKYDSVHRQYDGTVSTQENAIEIDGQVVYVYSERNQQDLPWKALDIDIVIESTGIFRTRDEASKHLAAGAKKVIISAPPNGEDVPTVVLGINDEVIQSDSTVISNASCTTNCAAPLIKVLDDLCA